MLLANLKKKKEWIYRQRIKFCQKQQGGSFICDYKFYTIHRGEEVWPQHILVELQNIKS